MDSEGGLAESSGLVASANSAKPTRVFVALKMAPPTADELAGSAKEIEQFPVRLIAPADIHLTLVPPWNEISISDAVAKLRRVAAECGEFTLEFRRIGYGPEPKRPRLLWVECAATLELAQLHAMSLVAFGQVDERSFRPHVTLARLGATVPKSRENIRLIETLPSRNESAPSSSCRRPGPVKAVTR
jgi:RNA 2',3'-cyclic 3'-phosphodiesterase